MKHEGLVYSRNHPSSVRCVLPELNLSITQVQLFGAVPDGPYWAHDTLRMTNKTVLRTPDRISLAMTWLCKELGYTFDAIMYHTSMWDFMNEREKYINTDSSELPKVYEKLLQDRLHDIDQIALLNIGRKLPLLLRSDALYSQALPGAKSSRELEIISRKCRTPDKLLADLNLLQYDLAQSLAANGTAISFFNYHVTAWSPWNFDYEHKCNHILGLNIHAFSTVLTTDHGLKIMGLRYTSVYTVHPSLASLLPSTLLSNRLDNHHRHSHPHHQQIATAYNAASTVNSPFRRVLLIEQHVGSRELHSNGAVDRQLYFVSYSLVSTLKNISTTATTTLHKGQAIFIQRHLGVSPDFLQYFRLSFYDIYVSSAAELHALPIGEGIAKEFAHDAPILGISYLVRSQDHLLGFHRRVEWWLLERSLRRPIRFAVKDPVLLSRTINATYINHSVTWDYMELFRPYHELPNVYNREKIVFIRYREVDSPVYGVQNGKKFLVVNNVSEILKEYAASS